jgi:hypothetical protein
MLERLRLVGSEIASAPATAAAALLCGLVFLFKPAQMFDANAPFLYFGFAQTALVLVPVFMMTFAALAWLASRGGQRLQRAAAAMLGGIALAAWINATFVASPGGALDGRTLLVPFDEERIRMNLLLCAGLAVGGTAIAWRLPVTARRFFAALFAVLAVQAAWIAASDDHLWRAQGATQRLAELSSEKNVIVILLDGFQSDFFAEIVEREPELARAFEGFTYFANAVGSAPTTYLAMPAIHSGIPYREGEGLRDTYRRSVVQGSFMAGLARNGYDAMLVNPILNYCPEGALCDHEGALVYGRVKTLAEAAAFLVDLAVFRIVPDAFKPSVYAEGSWMATQAFADERAVTSNRVLDLMARSMRIESRRPVARFVHLFGTHAPARLDANCLPVTHLPWVRQTAIAQDRCAVTKLTAVLRRLQDLGIYDRTAIAILADHGAGLPKEGRRGWIWGAYASPLLLVKPFGARGAFAHSTRVVGLIDLPTSLCAWTADCRMESGSDLARDTGEPPKYPFFVYYWRHEYWLAQSVPIVDRYEVRGPPGETASWNRVGVLQ